MSDPLSVSASVAGLLSLVIVVIDSTYQYISSVHSAPKAVASFFAELNELKTVLLRFYDLTHDTGTPTQADKKKEDYLLSKMNMDICKAELEDIRQKVEKRASAHGPTKMLHRLTWPFMEAETLALVEKLHRYGKVFHMALAADDLYVFQYVYVLSYHQPTSTFPQDLPVAISSLSRSSLLFSLE